MKFHFSIRQLQNDIDAAFLPFLQRRSLDLNGTIPCGTCVLNADGAAAARLDPMMKDSVWHYYIRAKARTWVVHLEQR